MMNGGFLVQLLESIRLDNALGEFGDLALFQLTPEGHKELARVRRLLKTYSWTVPTLSGGLLYLRDLEKLICMDLRVNKGTEDN